MFVIVIISAISGDDGQIDIESFREVIVKSSVIASAKDASSMSINGSSIFSFILNPYTLSGELILLIEYKGEKIPEPDGYIEKPPEPEELLEAIESSLK